MSHQAQLAHLPPMAPGMRIGLFGGTFNPPHQGHVLVAQTALRRLKLDRVWWLVTPGNPLKSLDGLPPQAERMAAARQITRDPRIVVTGFEAEIGARYTYETLHYLNRRAGDVHFVWIMGADNLRQFHRWQNWQDIARLMPLAIIDRPGSTLAGASAKAAQVLRANRRSEGDARRLAAAKAPAFVFLHGPRSPLSSTALRAMGSGGIDL